MLKIALKNVRVNKALSEETVCYSADLYIGGVKAGTVANRGHGGCDEQHVHAPFHIKDLDEVCAKEHPPLDMSEFGMGTKPADLELVCHRLVEAHEQLKRIKRMMKTKIVALEGQDIRTWTFKGLKSMTPDIVERFRLQKPDVELLNGKSDDEILDAIAKALR